MRLPCLTCEFRQGTGRQVLCGRTGHHFDEHENYDFCPHPDGPKFGTGVKPAGFDQSHMSEPEYFSPPPHLANGPGDVVKIILERNGITGGAGGLVCPNGKTLANCGCEAKRQEMNHMGWAECWRQRRELAEWFTAKAGECGIEVSTARVAWMLAKALVGWKRKNPAEQQ